MTVTYCEVKRIVPTALRQRSECSPKWKAQSASRALRQIHPGDAEFQKGGLYEAVAVFT